MAERRMFAKSVIESDIFLDLPMSARLLYFDLGMRGDDDGFVNSPKQVMRLTGAADDDLKILIAKNFIIPFESGIVVIRHWKTHNYLRSDRYKPTLYQNEKSLLVIETTGLYDLKQKDGIPLVYQPATEGIPSGSIGKVSIDKVSIEEVLDNPDVDTSELPEKRESVFITLTLVDKSEHPIFENQVSEFGELYPAVDIKQELRNMRGWCTNNPTKRKTKAGINRFINRWLADKQDKGGTRQYSDTPATKPKRVTY